MWSGITSLLWGSSEVAEQQEVMEEQPAASAQPSSQPTTHLKATAVEQEEDWVLVDQSSRGNSPQRMETHPMENLLIEHPSMSVYGPRGRPASTGIESESESSSEAEASQEKPESRVLHRQPPHRPRAVAARAGLLAQVQAVKSMQHAQAKHKSRNMTKSRIQRNNKVRDYQAHNKHQRRKHYMLRQSGAVNDRKSQ